MDLFPVGKYIYESPDNGQTVYRRLTGTDLKEIICSSEPDLFSYYEFKDILVMSKDSNALRKALDNLRLVYYTVKDGK